MITFKKAELGDADYIAALEKQYIELPWSKQTIENSLNARTQIYIAYFCGKAAGYGGIEISGDEAEVCNVVVDKIFRRQGIGKEIVNKLKNEASCQKAKKLFLEVAEDNEGAKALYTNNGFVKIAERKNYYGKKSALVMECALL